MINLQKKLLHQKAVKVDGVTDTRMSIRDVLLVKGEHLENRRVRCHRKFVIKIYKFLFFSPFPHSWFGSQIYQQWPILYKCYTFPWLVYSIQRKYSMPYPPIVAILYHSFHNCLCCHSYQYNFLSGLFLSNYIFLYWPWSCLKTWKKNNIGPEGFLWFLFSPNLLKKRHKYMLWHIIQQLLPSYWSTLALSPGIAWGLKPSCKTRVFDQYISVFSQ